MKVRHELLRIEIRLKTSLGKLGLAPTLATMVAEKRVEGGFGIQFVSFAFGDKDEQAVSFAGIEGDE